MPLVTNDTPRDDALLKGNSTTNTPQPVEHVQVYNPNYTGLQVDTQYTAYQNLLTYLEGAPWKVDYYSQIITTDSQLSGFQPTEASVYKPYHRIVGFELRVTNALATSQDDQSKTMTVTGTANMFPCIVPNEGDMIVADVGEGTKILFRVSSSIKKSIFTKAAYEIQYVANTDNDITIEKLKNQSVKTSYFRRDFLNFGQNPLIVEQLNNTLMDLQPVYTHALQQYFKKFFSREFQTLIIPGQGTSIYDHYLVKFLLSQFSTQEAHELRYIRALSVNDDPLMSTTTLWDAVRERSSIYMNEACRETGFVGTQWFNSLYQINGIAFTGISYAVYPKQALVFVDGTIVPNQKTVDTLVLEPSQTGWVGANVSAPFGENIQALDPDTQEAIKAVTVDEHYVLSEDFYLDNDEQSLLEGMVWQYIRKEPLDLVRLANLLKTYQSWGIVEQFYYVPLLLVMTRSALYSNA